jgi:hypothetical protein
VAYDWKTDLPGVFSHHADNCPIRDGGECTCGPLGYRASLRDWQTNSRTVSHTFETAMEALAWQQDQLVSEAPDRGAVVGRGDLGAVIDEFLQAAEDGMARNGHNERYTRERVRALRGALSYVESELGTMEVQDIRRRHVQALINQLNGSGVAPARVVAVTDALRDLYTYAIRRELVGFSPLVELELPQSENGGPPPAAPAAVTAETPPQGWTPGEPWTPPPAVGPPWTPAPFDAYGYTNGGFPMQPQQQPQPQPPQQQPPPYPPPGYSAEYAPPPYPQTGYMTERAFTPPPAPQPYGYESGGVSSMFGLQTGQQNANANYDSTMQERWLWWTVRIIVIVFVLIALVLVAESV